MAKLSTDQLIDAFKELTLIELSEFVSQFEEVFNVTAAAPVAAAAAGGAAPAAAEAQDDFTLVLENAGAQKIAVIKEVRTFTGLGLKEAKDLVDGAPSNILEKANKETVDKAKAAFEAAGATVSVK
jgi:large subunit ribosomal protein L7/L12